MKAYGGKLRRFRSDESGSLLLEASMTMPLLFLFTIVLLAAGFIAYQKTLVVHQSYQWSERAAYVWKDSHRAPVTGAFSYEAMDDIYSSMISEGLGWLGASFNGFRQASISLPDLSLSGQSLPGAKLLRSSGQLPSSISGQGSYYNRGLEGEVRGEWTASGSEDNGTASFFRTSESNATASSYYADPVEFLRTVDLVITYAQKLKARFSSPDEAAEELQALLPKAPDPPVINSEAKATAYLQQLAGGSGTKVETSYGMRQINAFDSDGFAHEAKYYVNKKYAIEKEIPKDVELMRTGKVKGVVWHFFYIEKEGKYDITPALQKELEKNGIMIVYHRQGG